MMMVECPRWSGNHLGSPSRRTARTSYRTSRGLRSLAAILGSEKPRASRMGDNREPEEGYRRLQCAVRQLGHYGWAVRPAPTTSSVQVPIIDSSVSKGFGESAKRGAKGQLE